MQGASRPTGASAADQGVRPTGNRDSIRKSRFPPIGRHASPDAYPATPPPSA